MAEPFLSEIRLMSFNFAPKGWAQCNGQLLPINQNQPLFALLGTMYGGDGRVNFALPDLRGRVPAHIGGPSGNFSVYGQRGGEVGHTLNAGELPAHTHVVGASSATQGGTQAPGGKLLGGAGNAYHSTLAPVGLRPDTVANVGGSQAHLNQQPFLTLSFCIALQGIFP